MREHATTSSWGVFRSGPHLLPCTHAYVVCCWNAYGTAACIGVHGLYVHVDAFFYYSRVRGSCCDGLPCMPVTWLCTRTCGGDVSENSHRGLVSGGGCLVWWYLFQMEVPFAYRLSVV